MTFTERDYQTKAHAAIFEAWRKDPATLLIMATGLGKTVVFSHVIKTFQPKRALVLAHRDELILQAKEKIEGVTGLPVEIEKADLYASTNLFHRMPVVVSSIQTQISGPPGKRRYLRFKPQDFGLVIADESHHTEAKSWKEVLGYYRQNSDLKILGCTATGDRADGKGLSMFDSVAYEYPINDAIQDGWLVDITQQFVPVTSLDFSHIRTRMGDLCEGELSKVMELEENIQGVCQPTLEVMFGLQPKTLSQIPVPEWRSHLAGLGVKPRRTIVFTVSVAQAEMCRNILSRAVDGIEWVCGKTRQDDRRSILSRFSLGETHAVVNCGVLLEGFDNPAVEVIVMARPTLSRALYAQMIGRATRPLAGVVDGLDTAKERLEAISKSLKPYCRILDFVGNSKHKLISCADILGSKVSEEVRDQAKATAIKEGKPKRILITLDKAQLDLERQRQEAMEKRRQEEEARKAHLIAKVDYRLHQVSAFDSSDQVSYRPTRSSDGRMFSAKQMRVLRDAGVDPCKVGYRQGQAIIGKVVASPSKKQLRTLYRYGYLDAAKWTREKAHKTLDTLSKNGWKRLDQTNHVPLLTKPETPF